jgi:hypothetical protein
MDINSPCQFCRTRHVDGTKSCHDSCIKYIEFSIVAEELRQHRHREIESKGIYINSITRNKKGHTIIV